MELLKGSQENSEKESTEEVKSKSVKWRNPFSAQQRKEEKEKRQKKKARLIVRNLSYKTTEEALQKHFQQWGGTLEETKILKRQDGKLVGCAFLQYATINQATKAILKANNKPMLGRKIYVDWALGKDEYIKKKQEVNKKIESKVKVEVEVEDEEKKEENEGQNGKTNESNSSVDKGNSDQNESIDEEGKSVKSEEEEEESESEDDTEDEDKKDVKSKLNTNNIGTVKHISNDVKEGCTVFIKNVNFDADDNDLRKVCRKFGLIHYAIINREPISGHSKGTAFVKFKNKESADLCLQAGTEFVLLDQVLDPTPALSRDEIRNHNSEKSKDSESKDSRNLYLAREGLIMAGSKAAEDVSAADMQQRHKLEQIKTQVLKNLNRFVSRNRLSIHNLPLNYDDEKLKQMVITYTNLKPHECRVMRENKITPENSKGKSKGFGFMSFSTHQQALAALRKLNNNPAVFGTQHRPIVAFSIEDRAVHKIKEKRKQKSKLSNPTYKEKLEKRKDLRREKAAGKIGNKLPKAPQSDNKEKLKKHIKKLEAQRAAVRENDAESTTHKAAENFDNYVGTAAKEGTSIRMRSNKKIKEQAQVHLKRVKADKRKAKQQKIKQIHLAERKALDRPKQGRKVETDDLKNLVNKYKRMIDSRANDSESLPKAKKPKRTKWYSE